MTTSGASAILLWLSDSTGHSLGASPNGCQFTPAPAPTHRPGFGGAAGPRDLCGGDQGVFRSRQPPGIWMPARLRALEPYPLGLGTMAT
jgi:hypothetical protein